MNIWKCIWMRFGNRLITGGVRKPVTPSDEDYDTVDWTERNIFCTIILLTLKYKIRTMIWKSESQFQVQEFEQRLSLRSHEWIRIINCPSILQGFLTLLCLCDHPVYHDFLDLSRPQLWMRTKMKRTKGKSLCCIMLGASKQFLIHRWHFKPLSYWALTCPYYIFKFCICTKSHKWYSSVTNWSISGILVSHFSCYQEEKYYNII